MGINVATAPKTSTFQVRINPEVKKTVEDILAECGLTLTEAFNIFLQQTINVNGLPFLMTKDGEQYLREQANALLASGLKITEYWFGEDWFSDPENKKS